jgi:hypothetical protein
MAKKKEEEDDMESDEIKNRGVKWRLCNKESPFHCLPPKLDGMKNKRKWWYMMEWIPSYSIPLH